MTQRRVKGCSKNGAGYGEAASCALCPESYRCRISYWLARDMHAVFRRSNHPSRFQ